MTTVQSAAATVVGDQQRQDVLEDLYNKDGRHAKDHPNHGLYTGLYQAAQQESRS
jgi:hypothetical protein